MLEIVINGETVLSLDSAMRFPGHQRQFMDTMDLDMDEGIELEGHFIEKPDEIDRAKYVAMNLVLAVQAKNDEMTNAMCAYLVKRQPDLKQVRANENGDSVEMDLIYKEMN